MYRAIDIASYIVDYCIRKDKPITNLQLQQVLYLLQKESLSKNHKKNIRR